MPRTHGLRALAADGLTLVVHPGDEPDEGALEALVAADGAVRALVLVHRLGLPQDGARWRAWCDARGLLLVEDARHALGAWTTGGRVGAHGHAAAFDLRATLGVPAALVLGPGAEPPSSGPLAQVAAALPALLEPDAAAARRGHALALVSLLGEGVVPGPFAAPQVGAAPLLLPARGIDAAALRRAGVVGVELPAGLTGLPVHQRLTPADVERVAAAAARARTSSPVSAPAPSAPAPSAPALTVARAASFAEVEPLWRELGVASGNPFSTAEWAKAWLEHLGAGADLHLLVCRDATGRATAILPLALRRVGPLRVLRFVGHGPADRLGPVCAPADLPAAMRALRTALHDIPHDVLVADQLPADDGHAALLGARVLRREASPALDTTATTWDAFLAARSKNFRRRERKLRREHDVVFRLADAQTLDADLDTLAALHDRRWGGTTGTFDGAQGVFHRAFAHAALDRGWLRLWILTLDGEPAAAWYGFRFASSDWYYQSGRDPRFEGELSVGNAMIAHTVRCAFEDGMAEFRLLRGGEEYKARFSTHDAGLHTAALARTPAGRAAVLAAEAALLVPADRRRALLHRLR